MNKEIKSLADEIRETLRGEQKTHGSESEHPVSKEGAELPLSTDAAPAATSSAAKSSTGYTENQVKKFFEQLEAFTYSGEQKSMIRVDARTMKLLRHLKLVRGTDMNKFIVFALHQLIAKNTWLVHYIQDALKNPIL